MTSNQHGPLMPWATLVLQWSGQWVANAQAGANPIKPGPSSDWRLQLASMKPESLVMAHQLRRREYVPRPCTHRPSHHESRLYPKSTLLTARRQMPKVWMVIGMKS